MVIVLYVLLQSSDNHVGILWLLYCMSFFNLLITTLVSYGYCIECPSSILLITTLISSNCSCCKHYTETIVYIKDKHYTETIVFLKDKCKLRECSTIWSVSYRLTFFSESLIFLLFFPISWSNLAVSSLSLTSHSFCISTWIFLDSSDLFFSISSITASSSFLSCSSNFFCASISFWRFLYYNAKW